MKKQIINLDYIKQFNPCIEGVDRYLKAGYLNFSGSIIDFIRLDKISFSDIKWVVFHEEQKILSDNLMREFALLCSLRSVEMVNIPEITYLYDIALLEYISGEEFDSITNSAAHSSAYSAAYHAVDSTVDSAADYTAYSAAYHAVDSAADSAADYAADFAADFAAYTTSGTSRTKEEDIQREILIDLIENGLIIMPERSKKCIEVQRRTDKTLFG